MNLIVLIGRKRAGRGEKDRGNNNYSWENVPKGVAFGKGLYYTKNIKGNVGLCAGRRGYEDISN